MSLWVFKYRNKQNMSETPIFITVSDTERGAEYKLESFLPKYLFEKVSAMQITNHHFIGVLAADNIGIEQCLNVSE